MAIISKTATSRVLMMCAREQRASPLFVIPHPSMPTNYNKSKDGSLKIAIQMNCRNGAAPDALANVCLKQSTLTTKREIN